MNAQQQLVSVDDISEENAPLIYVTDGLKPFIERVRSEVSGEVPDLSTKKGRDRIASLAAKVSKSKKAVENPGRDYLKRLKEMPKVVEAELREFVNGMDDLRDEVRKPLTDWEAKEAARVADFEERIDQLKEFAVVSDDLRAAGIQVQINNLQEIDIAESWQEFEAEAHRVKAASLETLQQLLTKRQAHEAQQAELERLREEQAAQAQREREAQLVREAEERARAEAAQAAQAEREAAIRREADAAAQAQARERQLQQQAEAAERERAASQQRAEQAERDATTQAEAAAAAERQRYLDEQKEVARQAALREADQANKAAVLTGIKESFMKAGVSEDQAKAIVNMIRRGEVPSVSIQY